MPKVLSSSKKRSAAPANAASGVNPALVKGFSMLYALPKTATEGYGTIKLNVQKSGETPHMYRGEPGCKA